MTTKLTDLIDELQSDKPIFGCDKGWMSQVECTNKSVILAAAMQAAGITKGDNVLILQSNCHRYVLSPLALWRLGAVPAMLYLTTATGELETICQNAQARYILVDNATKDLPLLSHLPQGCRILNVDELLEQNHQLQSNDAPHDSDPAVIIYTSGSSDRPKGVVHTHASLYSAAYNYIKTLQDGAYAKSDLRKSTIVNVYFLSGITSFQNLVVTLILRNRTYIVPLKYSLNYLAETVETLQAQIMQVPPLLLRKLMYDADKIDATKFRSVQCWFTTGAAFSPQESAFFESKIPGNVYLRYGLTESAAVFLQRPGADRRGVGQPIYGCEVKLVPSSVSREDGAGEVVFRTKALAAGYLEREEEWLQVCRDGWFYTGDIGKYDEDNNLHIIGRSKSVIMSGTYTVWVPEVEAVVRRMPGIKECYIFAVPDEILGEVVAVAIIPIPGQPVDWKRARDFCKAYLLPLKMPSLFWITGSVPHNRQKVCSQDLLQALWHAVNSSGQSAQEAKTAKEIHEVLLYFLGNNNHNSCSFQELSGDPYIASAICWRLSLIVGHKIRSSDLINCHSIADFLQTYVTPQHVNSQSKKQAELHKIMN
jgi:acyl-CoA synthetase (AMP-forming)/AMP-acid ligase II